ncbi:MAG: hypothetical protein PWP23_3217 [Candidatus Sumerlaeota bacterium]|nr:hypothetical protein [Candidatus Sumerlaeota bacterium]
MPLHPSVSAPSGCACPAKTIVLTTCRFLAGGAFLLAATMKLQDPQLFMLSIDAFGLVPSALVPFFAYAIPWTEIVAGLLLVYGFWSRAAGVVGVGLYGVFTAALAWVYLSGADVDCGCFGGLFGRGDVGPFSLVRNTIFIACSAVVVLRGAGAASLDHVLGVECAHNPSSPPQAGQQAP